jgi:pimeloyl-ACP methyl ester carboxylesterase
MPLDLASLRRLFPFRPNYIDVDGARMHYVDEGTGPPIVMLHGNPTWSFYYRELVKGLRDEYRVIAPDHIGCGLSEKPQDYAYTLATHIENLDRLLSHLGLGDATLALHDWGGAIGMGWATRHPELVRRLIVFNTAAFFFHRAPRRIRVCGWPLIGEVIVRGFNGFALGALRMAVARPEALTREVKDGYLFPYSTWESRVAHLAFVRDIPHRPGVPSFGLLKQIEQALPQFQDRPMLICWGSQDFCFDAHALAGWTSRFPRAVVHRFQDAGHYVVEEAHEHIVPLIRQFMVDRKHTPE